MAIDLIQLIAQSRANMMMRGFEPLCLTIGAALHRQIGDQISEDGVLLEMPVKIVTDMEGFAVQPGAD